MAFAISASKYKTRVEIQVATEAANDVHEIEYTWRRYASRWALVAPSSGREFQQALQTVPMLQAIVRMRSDETTRAITPKYRLKIGTRVLNIAAVYDETNERREVVLWCVEEAQT